MQAAVQVEVTTESKNMQDDQCVEDLKLVELLRHIIAEQVRYVFSQDQTDPKLQYQTTGFTKRDYDKFYKEDLVKMTFAFDLAQAKDNSQPIAILAVENPHATDGELQIKDVYEQCKTLGDVLSTLQMKRVDLVIGIDSCCAKKDGRSVQLMPKLRIHQAILHETNSQANKKIGLVIPSQFKKPKPDSDSD